MIKYEVLGAIDVGSNAARLLITEVFNYQNVEHYKKRTLVRVPLRLGEDVFETGRIPDNKIIDIINTMKGYKGILDANRVTKFWACATSAMREAQNGAEICRQVKAETGVDLQIIEGGTEARLLYETHFEELLSHDKSYLYIDVGGGSTELTVYNKGQLINSRSFNIGTLRLIQELVDKSHWNEMKSWIQIHCNQCEGMEAIGSGGNINKLYKLNGSRMDKKISYLELEKLKDEIEESSFMERVVTMGMRFDRADVIVPATHIFLKAMKWARIKEVNVPKFGLSDGIVRMLRNKSEVLS